MSETQVVPKTTEKPAAKKPSKRVTASEDECLAASFFALKTGSVVNAKKVLQELNAQHAATIKFIVDCGGLDDAVERLDELAERLEAA
jgi:hypothetical protein